MLIIKRHIIKEIWKTFAVITAILLLIAISNRLVVLLARSVDSQFPLTAIVQAVCLIIPELLTAVIPIGFFTALIFTYSRMYADNEMVILLSSGITVKNIIRLNTNIAIIITAALWCCSLAINPLLNHVRNTIAQEQYNNNIHRLLKPGKFQSILGGKVILYTEEVRSNGDVKNIFLIVKSPNNHIPEGIITSEYAKLHNGVLTLKHGNRYEGFPGRTNYRVISFDEYIKPLVLNSDKPFERMEKLTTELLSSSALSDKVELQMRLAMPAVTIILGILAISLAKIKPRANRFSNLAPTIIIFLIYYISLIFTKSLMLQAHLPIYSLWLIHLIFLIYAGYQLNRRSL